MKCQNQTNSTIWKVELSKREWERRLQQAGLEEKGMRLLPVEFKEYNQKTWHTRELLKTFHCQCNNENLCMSQNPEPETSIGEYPLYISHCY